MRITVGRFLAILALLLAGSVLSSAAQQGSPPAPLQLTSSAFADGTMIPEKYTCAAGTSNMVSPPLSWVNAPTGTQSFVLLLHDPEPHPRKAFNDVTHWLIFNIPGDATSLPEGVKADSTAGVQGNNIANQPAYFGPCAPPGPNHHYTFELFALDTKLDLQKGASRDDVQKAMDGHVLGGSEIIALFHRTTGGRPPQ